jgi:predicted RNA-binding Zn-ribbon protein involved in translation (DUF1610 family)
MISFPLACLSGPGVLLLLFVWSLPFLVIGALVIVIPVGVARGIHDHRRLRAESRAARGLCPRCGYDLRASPLRCPECGRATSAARSASDDWPIIELDE